MTNYPIYIVDLNEKNLVVFPEMKAEKSHSDFWEEVVAKIVAKHFGIPLQRLLNLLYCQRRARISSKGLVFYGEKQTKILLRTISKATGETNLRWAFDEHEARLPFDVMEFKRLIRDT